MYIADEKIEEVRTASDIVDVVSDYVKLKKRGSNFVGLCPFHSEKTPSFNVNPGMQIYKCFGCGQGGDVFQFIKTIEKVEFPDAVRLLADQAGIEIPKPDQSPRDSRSEGTYAALRFASDFFRRNLYRADNEHALLYLTNHREFDRKTLDDFNIGYALNSWDSLLTAAKKASLTTDNLVDAGLVVRKDSGSYYDRYRDRIIFPIHSPIGKIVGFGGRLLGESDRQAKYINSPETDVYHKSEILYGLYESKQAIRGKEEALLVEGYTDVMALHQAGIQNVVASSGTSLTDQQVSVLSRYCRKVVMLYDGDPAGVKATVRGIETLLKAGLAPYVVTLPQGEDPDTVVRQKGPLEFEKFIESFQSDFISFALSILHEEGVFATPEGTAAGQRRIIRLISLVTDDLVREAYVQRAAELLGLAEFRIHDELRRIRRGAKVVRRRKGGAQVTLDTGEGGQESGNMQREVLPEEKSLIRLMIEGGESMVELILSNMSLDEFTEGPARETVSFLLQMYEAGTINTRRLVDGSAGEAVRELVAEVMVSEVEPSRNWERMQNISVPRLDENARASAVGSMRYLKLDRVNEAISRLKDRIFQAAEAGNDVHEMQQQLQSLFETRRTIESDSFLVEQ